MPLIFDRGNCRVLDGDKPYAAKKNQYSPIVRWIRTILGLGI